VADERDRVPDIETAEREEAAGGGEAAAGQAAADQAAAGQAAAEQAAADQAGLRDLSLVSILAGACELIPVPLLDDWAESLVRRRAVADLLRGHGFDPTPGDVEVLAGLERSGGCLQRAVAGALVKLPLYLVKKLVRKVVFVLAIHEAVEAASALLHETYLLRHGLRLGALSRTAEGRVDRDSARWLRWAVEATIAGTDTRPLHRAVRGALGGSRSAVAAAGARLGRQASAAREAGAAASEAAAERAADELPLEREERELAGAVDRLNEAVWLQAPYRAALERRLEGHLAAASQTSATPGAGGPP